MNREEASVVKRLTIMTLSMVTVTLFVAMVYRPLILPFFVAAFLTFLLLPLVNKLEARYRVRRIFCVFLAASLVILAVSLFIAGVVPLIKGQVIALIELMPRAKAYLLEQWLPWLQLTLTSFGLPFPTLSKTIEQAISVGGSAGGTAVWGVWRQTSGIIGGVFNVVITMVMTIFFLNDYKKVRSAIRRLIPADLRPMYKEFFSRIDQTLWFLIKGQATVALIVGCLYMAGLSLVGMKYGLAIGAIAGFCRIVPYLELVVGLTLCAFAMVTDPEFAGWSIPIGVAVVFGVVQVIDGMFINPKILGGRVGLHPGVVIASIVAFSYWLGFWGVVVAIPIIAVVKVWLEMVIPIYQKSVFFNSARASRD